MSNLTDPARELADLCASLNHSSNKNGADVLSKTFGVPSWSAEFYQIIFTITDRFNSLKELLSRLDMDDDIREAAYGNIEQMKLAFTPNGLGNSWSHALQSYLSPANVAPIRMLSAQVRPLQSYPKLEDGDIEELNGLVQTLLDWLSEQQLSEQDFIRQALIEGLKSLQFRLTHVRWLGWGYTLQSLREVIGAYMALEKGAGNLSEHPDADAILRKTAAFVRAFFEKVSTVKEAADTGVFMLQAYGAATLMIQGGQSISGLLQNLSGTG